MEHGLIRGRFGVDAKGNTPRDVSVAAGTSAMAGGGGRTASAAGSALRVVERVVMGMWVRMSESNFVTLTSTVTRQV